MLAAPLLAACHAPPAPPPVAIVPPPAVQWGQGIDMATNAGEVLGELQQNRLGFVARYYREPESRWPALSSGEAQLLSSMGLKIVAVWESRSRTPAHFSYATGYNDALTAYREAKAIGQPAGSAIYFAVDFNARDRSLDLVDEYFAGIMAGLTAASGGVPDYAIGVYGSGAVCDALKAAGLAKYAWLSNSFAWDGSLGYEDWNIRQGSRLPELSFNQDGDEARGEYGGFQLAGYDVASPNPPNDHLVAGRTPAPQYGQYLTTTVSP